MSNCAIVGINWGDEGKGRMVDLLTADYDVVVRYQGGGNAGHTVVNEFGKFALHLLPSGIFRPGVVNILGNGVALDCESLWTEIADVTGKGVAITPENLKISDRASLLLPWHRDLDALEEARLADKKYGSTKQGIAPFYSDKYQKKTVMAGELLYPDKLWDRLAGILEWKNLTLHQGLRRQALHHGGPEGLGGGLRREDQALPLRHRRLPAPGHKAGQEHPVRGPAGLPAGPGLRHLPL